MSLLNQNKKKNYKFRTSKYYIRIIKQIAYLADGQLGVAHCFGLLYHTYVHALNNMNILYIYILVCRSYIDK